MALLIFSKLLPQNGMTSCDQALNNDMWHFCTAGFTGCMAGRRVNGHAPHASTQSVGCGEVARGATRIWSRALGPTAARPSGCFMITSPGLEAGMPTGRVLDAVALAEGNPNGGADGSLLTDGLCQAALDMTGTPTAGSEKGLASSFTTPMGFHISEGLPPVPVKIAAK